MPRRKTIFAKDYYYHIYNRGAEKQNIFFETENYYYFLRLMKRVLPKYAITFIAYCLMPNHFHFLIKLVGEADVSSFMSRLLNAYVKAVNKRYNRKGLLFNERFKPILVDDENYLVHLCRYIHLNPLKAGLVKDLKDWPFSNYLEFIGLRNGSLFDPNFRNEYFGDANGYKEFVNDLAIKEPEGFGKIKLD